MAAEQEIRASREQVEGFVGELRGFYNSLEESKQAMMGTILEAAQAGETGGYRYRWGRYDDPTEGGSGSSPSEAEGWNDLVGWIEEQGEEDTQGFGIKRY